MMSKTRSAFLSLYAALTPVLASAKCGNVDYSWGADALASAHDYAVTMMLYEIFGQNHTHISYLQIKLKVFINHL